MKVKLKINDCLIRMNPNPYDPFWDELLPDRVLVGNKIEVESALPVGSIVVQPWKNDGSD